MTGSNQVQQGHVLGEFKEVEEVRTYFGKICEIYNDQVAVEMTYEKVLYIFDQYQEQPHLLDPHLESLLEQLLNIARSEKTPDAAVNLAFKFMYLLTKTRGYKVIVRLMPHEVSDLEPVLALLAKQKKDDHQTWETRYMLLLWLSMVCMIPFDMVRLDGTIRAAGGDVRQPIMDRIIAAGQDHIKSTDKSRDAAAYMLSRFMTRHDVKKEKLPAFLDSTLQTLSQIDADSILGQKEIFSHLSTLALLYKHGKREDLLPFAAPILQQIKKLKVRESTNSALRKMNCKLVQRLALAFLKPKVAAWRYQRGSRSLAENLTTTEGQTTSTSTMKDTSSEDDEEYDIPEEMEDVIEQLLDGLRDLTNVVRWSAAKGIGRVTGRLPKELADEVVGSLMDLFTISESDGAWQGGCLALAELGRRGLLLPQRLPDVVPVIVKSLGYDEKRGFFSVGSHVRDAACYVCWAFARAYDPAHLKPYVQCIASALLIIAVFDREINVRRAAAAAFQENVGRQGQFPHGIDIVVACDYYAVGRRNDCYLDLSVYLAQFEEYTDALIDHLWKVKYSHWDPIIRESAAQAMYKLTPVATRRIIDTGVLSNCMSMDLNERHGSILMAAHMTLAVAEIAVKQDTKVSEMLRPETIEQLKALTQKLHDAQLFRGAGGELMRRAVCCLIEKLSQAKMPFSGDPIIGVWNELIEDCLGSVEPGTQIAAIASIPHFFTMYYQQADGLPVLEEQDKILKRYLKELENPLETTRMGFALGLGALPKFMLHGRLMEVISGLIKASQVGEKELKFAESRRDAIQAITSIFQTVGVDISGSPDEVICPANIPVIYDALFTGTEDYTLDSRGDVGAWVREAAMSGLKVTTSMLVNIDPSQLKPEWIQRILCNLAQQACEKIDRTRELAGEVFVKLLYHEPEVPHIPHRQELLDIFPWSKVTKIYMNIPSNSFPFFTEMLTLPTYAYHVLLGLTVSVGGLTETLVRHSSAALLAYLRRAVGDLPSCARFGELLLKVCADNARKDRVMLPMLKMLDYLLSNACFALLAEDPNSNFGAEVLSVCKQEVFKCGDPQKLLAALDVCCGLLQFQEIQKRTLHQLLIFLCHRYPIVRKNGAQKLYESVLTYDNIVDEERLDDVLTILSETQWDEPVQKVKPIRNQLCDLFNVARPVPKASSAAT